MCCTLGGITIWGGWLGLRLLKAFTHLLCVFVGDQMCASGIPSPLPLLHCVDA